MVLTLTADIAASDRLITVTGTVPGDVVPGYSFRLDNEMLTFQTFDAGQLGALNAVNVQRWHVRRGENGTVRATHAAGAAVYGAVDANVASTDTTPPNSFDAGSGESGVPATWTLDGDGSPIGVVTPSAAGHLFYDATHGALYLATGTTDVDWLCLGNATEGHIGDGPGVTFTGSNALYVLAGGRDDALGAIVNISATYDFWNGNSQGLVWQSASGGQFSVRTGLNGEFLGILQDSSGDLTPARTIRADNIPTSNPGPGLVWCDTGAGNVLKVGT